MILLIRKKLRTKASFGKHRLRNSSIAWETDFYKFQDFFKISFKEFRNIVPFVQINFFGNFEEILFKDLIPILFINLRGFYKVSRIKIMLPFLIIYANEK